MMKMISSLRMVIAATAIAGSGASAAADTGVCSGDVDGVAVPAAWQQTVKDGIVSYRAPSSVEALTAALYEVKDPSARRSNILRKLVEVARATETRFGGPRVVLSPVSQQRHGSRLQTCWSGEDFAAKRRFVSVASSRGNLMEHFYYEAIGVSTAEFERRAATIFTRDTRGAGAATSKLVRVPTIATGRAPLIVPALLPALELQ